MHNYQNPSITIAAIKKAKTFGEALHMSMAYKNDSTGWLSGHIGVSRTALDEMLKGNQAPERGQVWARLIGQYDWLKDWKHRLSLESVRVGFDEAKERVMDKAATPVTNGTNHQAPKPQLVSVPEPVAEPVVRPGSIEDEADPAARHKNQELADKLRLAGFISPKEAVSLFGGGQNSYTQRALDGKLNHVRVGMYVFVDRNEAQAFRVELDREAARLKAQADKVSAAQVTKELKAMTPTTLRAMLKEVVQEVLQEMLGK